MCTQSININAYNVKKAITIQVLSKVIHMSIIHCNKTFTCDVCGEVYNLKCSLDDHVKYSHEGKKHTCNICQKIFTRRQALALHIKRDHQEKSTK